MQEQERTVLAPPRGWRRLITLGPGLVWAASSVGVGELVFATRAGALFGLALLWAPIVSIILKYFITELVGRYTLVTGENVVQAFARVEVNLGFLRLPPGWIRWIFWIFFIASVAGMGGIALAVGSSLHGLFPAFSYITWAIIALASVGLVLLLGSYKALEMISRLLVAVMIFFIFYAVFKAPPPAGDFVCSLVPHVPSNSLRELLPLLGWTGAGAIGTIWFSLWTQSTGRGTTGPSAILQPDETRRVRDWMQINRIDLGINSAITAVLTVGFLIAGSSILRPLHIVPGGEGMGTALAKIAGDSFGQYGEIIFLVGVFATLYSTLLADVDGLCRVAKNLLKSRLTGVLSRIGAYRIFLCVYILFSALFAAIIPAPVILLQFTALIDTLLLPVVIVMGVSICLRFLPEEFRPGRFTVFMAYGSAAFFTFFIVLLAIAVGKGLSFGL